MMYAKGQSAAINPEKATYYFKKAAAAGNPMAKKFPKELDEDDFKDESPAD